MFTLIVIDPEDEVIFEEDFSTLREAKKEGEYPEYLNFTSIIMNEDTGDTLTLQHQKWVKV